MDPFIVDILQQTCRFFFGGTKGTKITAEQKKNQNPSASGSN